MQAVSDPKTRKNDPCEVYFYIAPDEEPELHLPEDEVQLEEPLLDEAGETEESFGANTSVWE